MFKTWAQPIEVIPTCAPISTAIRNLLQWDIAVCNSDFDILQSFPCLVS